MIERIGGRAPRARCVVAAIGSTVLLLTTAARSEDAWSVAVISAQGVDSDLLKLVPKALAGDLEREPSYAAGVIVGRRLASPGLAAACADRGIKGCRVGWEVTALKHSGLQHPYELAGGVHLGLDLVDTGRWRLGLATTQGFSNVFGHPGYEDGSREAPDRRYRFQYHMAYELDYAHAAWAGWSAGLRIHHRSGLYGLVAPPRVGSNFVGLVVRRAL